MTERAQTNGIEVEAQSFFIAERSDPFTGKFFFSYRIRIKNNGATAVRLLHRQWLITDGLGRVETVKGPGVIGQQPRISPGETFEYESHCPLTTPTGTMRGFYDMADEEGRTFQAAIPEFFLSEPRCFH